LAGKSDADRTRTTGVRADEATTTKVLTPADQRRDTTSTGRPAALGAREIDAPHAGAGKTGGAAGPPRKTPHMRWWKSVVSGLLVSLPVSWLLSYAGTLPFFLGLFFFVLFGLMIGAVMHRVAAPHRPYGTGALVAGTTLVVVGAWSVSLLKEGRDFPSDQAAHAGRKTRDIGSMEIDEYQSVVATRIQEFLLERYPPGGAIGYMRWASTSGEIRRGELEDVSLTLTAPQSGYAWIIRVILSLALLAFGVGSQTLPLRLASERALRAIDNPAHAIQR